MKYSNVFGKESSRIILGTAYFGDGIGEDIAYDIMDKYVSLGGTHIDTARLYADGKAEEIIGRWMKLGGRTDIIISTKCGYPTDNNPQKVRLSEKEIRSDLEKSLKALGVDTIDFFWLHRDDEEMQVGEIIDIMNALVKEGKIKKFGASNWKSARISLAQEYAMTHNLEGFSASQLRFNPGYALDVREGLVGMNKEEFAFYKNANMPVVAYSSQAKGFFSKMAEIGESALSEKAKKRYLCDINLKKLEILKELSLKYNSSVAAIITGAFCSFKSPVAFPIIGGRNIVQIEDSMKGADVELTENEINDIFRAIID